MVIMPPSSTQRPLVMALAAELPTLPHGGRQARVAAMAQTLAVSPQTLRVWLKEAGYCPVRKRRADHGVMKAVTPEQARAMAAIKVAGARETGKVLPTFEMARQIANANAPVDGETGEVAHCTAHSSTISRAMKKLGCHPTQLARQTPAHPQKSLHPNHVWQVDVSTCVLFYLANGGMEVCEVAAFNKNKPHNFARVQELRVQRYLAVDHCSGAFHLAYLPGHETTKNLLDFLIPAFHQRDNRPLYGVPKILMVDPGSAQAAPVFRNLARALDLKVLVHEAGNARAKGAVESTHNHIEHQFEGRLIAQRVRDFDHLNELAAVWSAAYQATAIHSRTLRTRYAGWMEITRAQLRIAPGIETTRALVMADPDPRIVTNTMTISFAPAGYGQQDYLVKGIPGAAPGEALYVVASPYTLPDIDVLSMDAAGNEVRHRLSPIPKDQFGFVEHAAVIGDEFKAMPDTFIEHERKAAQRAAWGTDDAREIAKIKRGKGGERGVAFGGALDSFADVRAVEVPSYLPRAGTAIEVTAPAVAESVMTATAACLRMQTLLGDAWQPGYYAWIMQRFAEGIGEEAFQRLAAQWQGNAARDEERRAC